MSSTHIHLLITHLPIFGSMLGAIVLLIGIWNKSNTTKIAAYTLFVISSIGAGIAYLSGEGAEESIEELQGVVESTIELHQNAALLSLVALIFLGFISLIAIYLTSIKSSLTNLFSFLILICSLMSFVLVARTGYLGGKIRHTEIDNSSNSITSKDSDD